MRISRLITIVTVAIGISLAGPGPVRAQNSTVLDALQALLDENAELYAEPLTVGLGLGLNGGFNSTAAVHDVLGFDIGVRVVGALVPDELDVFQAVPPAPVTVTNPNNSAQSVTTDYAPRGGDWTTPTVTGPGDGGDPLSPGGVVLEPTGAFLDSLNSWGADPSEFNLPFPEGFDIPAIPFAVIQGSVGVPLGTDLTVRFIPAVEVTEEVGEIEAFGFGIRHSVSQWFPGGLPVDLAVSFGWQDLSVGEYLDASGTNYGAVVSKDWGVLALYGAGTVSNAEVDITYTFQGDGTFPSQTVRLNRELDTDTRLAAGFNLDLLILDISAEYALAGEMDVVSAQVGFSFR